MATTKSRSRSSFHNFEKYKEARSSRERCGDRVKMEEYLKLHRLNPSLSCLLGLVAYIKTPDAYDSRIRRSQLARPFEPTEKEIADTAEWIRLNYSDEIIPILSFSKNLTIHQLACAVLRIERQCLNRKTGEGICFSIPLTTLLETTGVEEPLPEQIMRNVDSMGNIIWSFSREQLLRGLISYSFELSAEGILYRSPFVGKLAGLARDARFFAGGEFLAENRGKSWLVKKAKDGVAYGLKDVVCKADAMKAIGKKPEDHNVAVTFLIGGMETFFSVWKVSAKRYGEIVQFIKMGKGFAEKIPGLGFGIKALEFIGGKIFGKNSLVATTKKLVELLDNRTGASLLRVSGSVEEADSPVHTLRTVLRSLMVPGQPESLHKGIMEGLAQLQSGAGDDVPSHMRRNGFDFAPGTDTRSLHLKNMVFRSMIDGNKTILNRILQHPICQLVGQTVAVRFPWVKHLHSGYQGLTHAREKAGVASVHYDQVESIRKLMGNWIGLVTGQSILTMRQEAIRKIESGGGRSKLLLRTMDETKEVLQTIGSYPDDPYVQHLVLGLMFIRYDAYTTGVTDEKQMAALGKIFESEPNAAKRIVYWGSLVVIYHTFSVTVTRFVGRAVSRLMLSFMPKSGGDESCP